MVDGRPLRTVFFGTPAFAVPSLQALLASSHPVAAVVTQPDRPRDRGQKLTLGEVKAAALAAGLPVLQPASLKDDRFLDHLRAIGADIGVVAAYGRILTTTVLAIPPRGMINVHASLLPRYRGAAPIHRAVAAGERETGVTIMRVVKALDAGAMLASVRRPIADNETSEEVERDLARLGAELLVATMDRLAAGPIPEEPQNDAQATYAARLTKEDGLVDWSRTARQIHDQVRGMRPWPNAYSYINGMRLILLRSSVDERHTGSAPGTVIAGDTADLYVAAGAGTLVIHELQAEGRRPMPARAFLAGHPLSVGARFTSSP